MRQPRMVIIAGPPGAGKSSVLSLSDFAEHVFNADDRAAELNAGSYRSIPLQVRAIVNREVEQFVHANIAATNSFALETTLRSAITFERVKRRAAFGGRSASETTLRRIHASSLANLPLALNPDKSGIEIVRIYDNSRSESRPNMVLETRGGKVISLADEFPACLAAGARLRRPALRAPGRPGGPPY